MPDLQRHAPIRTAVIELFARAQASAPGDPVADERYFLDQLRAALAGEAPAERLVAACGGARGDRLARLYARCAGRAGRSPAQIVATTVRRG